MADESKYSDDEHYDDDEDGPGGRNQGRWSREEHSAFMEGLRLHGREWKKIAAMIPSRTVVQIRTHAQKFFQKQAKSEGRNLYVDEGGIIEKRDTKRLKVTAPRPPAVINAPSRPAQALEAKDVSAAAGGITPRTVAAATILLGPRYKDQAVTPHTRDWINSHAATAVAVLENQPLRRTSPRLSAQLPPQWPGRAQPLDDGSGSSGRPTPSPPAESRGRVMGIKSSERQ